MPWSTGCRGSCGRLARATAMAVPLALSTLGIWSITLGPDAGATTPGITFHVSAPSTATAGARIAVAITAVDAHGNPVAGYQGAQRLTFSGPARSPDSTAPSYPPTIAFSSGTGYATVSLTDAQTTTLTATQGPITGTSAPIAVSPASAATLYASTPPTPTAGVATVLNVTATDAYGNLATNSDGTLHFSSSAPYAVLPTHGSLTAGIGSAGLSLETSGPQTLTVTDTVEPTLTATFKPVLIATTPTVTVRPAAAATFELRAPNRAVADTATRFTVTAFDAFGNVATGYAGAVQFASSDPSAKLPSDGTLTRGAGTFPVTFGTAGNQGITATDPTNSLINTAATVIVGAAPATTFHLTTPATATVGDSFDLTITARDAHGTTTGYAGAVHVASSDPSVMLPPESGLTRGAGTLPVVFETAGPETLTVTDPAEPAVTATTRIMVSPASPALFQAYAPASVKAGTPTTITVTALDAFGNVATGYSGTVRLAGTDPSATLPSDAVLTRGTGTFRITFKTAGPQTVTVTDPADPLIATGATIAVGQRTATL